MRIPLLLLCLVLVPSAFATNGVDEFRAGLAAFQANGPDALFRTWYRQDDQDTVTKLKQRMRAVTRDLGEVVETEVFAPRSLGRHVHRLYGVIYFRRAPLWVRAEYYSIAGQSGFLSLEFSRNADDILPLEIGTSPR